MTNARIILTTAGSAQEARKLARVLVERGLAACVNVVPRIESVYRWQDKVESAREWLLVVKTSRTRVKAVQATIKELHSYDLPECISIAIDDGSPEYLKWLAAQVK